MKEKLKWIDINKVLPNPRNPRKDHSINSIDMQDIIRNYGWEEGITCYQKGDFYIILSGHRRWYAAKMMSKTTVPIYIVEAPNNDAEELERLGSIQGGQVDWNPYEWAKFTYDIWKSNKEVSYNEIAKKLGISKNLVVTRIKVCSYYTENEIESKLSNGMYSISMLYYIFMWIIKLKKYQSEIVSSLGEDLIKNQLLKKYENKSINSQLANDAEFVKNANQKDIIEFLTDPKKTLKEAYVQMTLQKNQENTDLIINSMAINATITDVQKIKCRTKTEAEKLIKELDNLLVLTRNKESHLNQLAVDIKEVPCK